MSYYCDRISATFEGSHGALRPSHTPQLKINFSFFFTTEYVDYRYVLRQDSPNLELLGSYPFSSDYRSITVVVGKSLSFENLAVAVGDEVDDLLSEEDRDELIGKACDEVRLVFPTAENLVLPERKTLDIVFKVRIQHMHVYRAEMDGYHGMVPAADRSLALLEKYEVGRGRGGEEEECCICLEELGRGGCGCGCGRGALKMPCSHVFHGGCIKKWLRSSHYCPLCRYEMPTE